MPWRAVSRLREASDQVAAFVGSRPDDLVFVPNVTTGINAVLGSLPLGPGDELVITDLAYGAVALAARRRLRAQRRDASNRSTSTTRCATPATSSSRSSAALTPRTKLVVIDHVTAQTALVLPVAAIAAECRARGVPVLVDGAHVPGSRPLDIPSLGVDWYAANLHKWAHAPRGCGILWAAPERQSILRSPVVSWGHEQGFPRRVRAHRHRRSDELPGGARGHRPAARMGLRRVRRVHARPGLGGRRISDRPLAHDVRDPARHGRDDGDGAVAAERRRDR